jgi:hypothetical protein
VSDLGRKHAEMLRDFLVANYSNWTIVDTFNEPVISVGADDFEDFSTYDIVLSNNPIKGYENDNVLIVNNFFSASDRENLLNFIVAHQKSEARKHLKALGNIKTKTAKELYFSQQLMNK